MIHLIEDGVLVLLSVAISSVITFLFLRANPQKAAVLNTVANTVGTEIKSVTSKL